MRANELGEAFGDLGYQLRALVGLVIFSRMSADFSPALALSRRVDAIAKEIATPLALAAADCLLASSLLWVDEYADARTRAERSSRENSPEVRRAHLVRYGYDHWMNSRTLRAGYPRSARLQNRHAQILVFEGEQVTPAIRFTGPSDLIPRLSVTHLEFAHDRFRKTRDWARRQVTLSLEAWRRDRRRGDVARSRSE